MKAFVITMFNEPRSIAVSDRCIETGDRFNVKVEKFKAVTACEDPVQMMADRGFATRGFANNVYSRPEPCLAAFLSHAALWSMACEEQQAVLVLEHDAVFVDTLPQKLHRLVPRLCNLGKPSFGSFLEPKQGIGPLVSKPGGYLGGAHAYYVTPAGAADLLRAARTEAEPTDMFINRTRFPKTQEYYPWPVICDDNFSTIQWPLGCVAKHNKVDPI